MRSRSVKFPSQLGRGASKAAMYSYAEVHQAHPRKPTPSLSKRGFLTSVTVALVLEVGFIVLSLVCLKKPLPLQVPLSLSNAKAAFSAIFILWQFVATIPLATIVDHCFSSEWYFQTTQTKDLLPGRTDVVSILTAGMLDKIQHATTRQASNRFRVAFGIAMTCLAIRAIAPTSLSPALILQETPARIRVTRATLDAKSSSTWFYLWLSRAGMIGQLEQQKVLTFGLDPPKGYMVGWPSTLATGLEGRLRYPTDVMSFDFQCNWENRDFLSNENPGTINLSPPNLPSRATNSVEGSALLPFPLERNDSDYRVAFLIFAQNTSDSTTTGIPISLEGIPTFSTTGLDLKVSLEPLSVDAATVALLVCDPHLSVSGGEVQLDANGTITVTRSQGPTLGNIDQSPEFLQNFMPGSIAAFFAPDTDTSLYVTIPALQAFFPLDGAEDADGLFNKSMPPLPLQDISENLNGIATSIAKAFSSGFVIGEKFGGDASSMLLDVDGHVEKQQLVLATNPRTFWIGVGLWLFNICLLILLAWLMRWEEMKPFALEYLLPVINGGDKVEWPMSSKTP
ncbi:hypothetical protein D9756_002016 [Leucocoprinus leucothites]|uniref:Uncharacterized protein n=1 Tax=Leucocoprinus leucothites TaxID=201217 RepID=A0A8H5LLS9_9AGAR|nr:hypothetical protein D9756_002016 [Leucoagaricus leucothites]